jgi:hypothetical protein
MTTMTTVTTAQLRQAKELCPTRLRLNAAVTQIDTGSRRQSISTWKPSFSQISCAFKNRSQHLKMSRCLKMSQVYTIRSLRCENAAAQGELTCFGLL